MDKKPRLIDANDAVDLLERMAINYASIGRLKEAEDYAVTADILRNKDIFKTIEAEPVRHGRWIDGMPYTNSHWRVCSECHRSADHPAGGHEYCGHCGAKMDGGAEDER